jgi:hypothetical protein
MLVSEDASKAKTAPVIACHSSTAAALGAVLIKHPDEAKKLGHACIPIKGSDGSYWMWPLERDFLAAIERYAG